MTGGAGFIGSHLVDALLAEPDTRVTVLDRLTTGGSRANLEQHDGDDRLSSCTATSPTRRRVRAARRRASDAVIHAAAESHVDRSIDDPRGVRRDERDRHAGRARRVREHGTRMLMVSTDEVYGPGDPDGGLFDEDTRCGRAARTRRARRPRICCAGVPRDLRRAGDGGARHERVRPAADRARRADVRADRARGPPGARVRRRARSAASSCTSQDWVRAAVAVLDRGEPGVHLQHRRRDRAGEPASSRGGSARWPAPRRPRSRSSPTGPATTSATAWRRPPARARLGAGDRVRRGARAHGRVVPRPPRVALAAHDGDIVTAPRASEAGRVRLSSPAQGGDSAARSSRSCRAHHEVHAVRPTRTSTSATTTPCGGGRPAGGPTLIVNLAAFTKVDANEADPARAFRDNAHGPAEPRARRARLRRDAAARLHRLRVRRREGRAVRRDRRAGAAVASTGARSSRASGLVRSIAAEHSSCGPATCSAAAPTTSRGAVGGSRAARTRAGCATAIGSPTFVGPLAERLLPLLLTGRFGTYHLAGPEAASLVRGPHDGCETLGGAPRRGPRRPRPTSACRRRARRDSALTSVYLEHLGARRRCRRSTTRSERSSPSARPPRVTRPAPHLVLGRSRLLRPRCVSLLTSAIAALGRAACRPPTRRRDRRSPPAGDVARRPTRTAAVLPRPSTRPPSRHAWPIKHVVFLIKENRTLRQPVRHVPGRERRDDRHTTTACGGR